MPGNQTRRAALRSSFPSVWRMLVATALTLILAGIVEGSFSQFSGQTFPHELKIAVAIILFASLIMFLFVRQSKEEGAGIA